LATGAGADGSAKPSAFNLSSAVVVMQGSLDVLELLAHSGRSVKQCGRGSAALQWSACHSMLAALANGRANMRVAMSLFPSLRILIPVACVLVAVSVCQRAFAETAATVHFAPHRAIYEINLNRSASGSGVTSLSGRMVYELGGSACEGYTQNMRFVTRMGSQDGGETINDLRNSSWEDASGKRLRFSTTQFANEIIVESSQGDVKRATADAAATVDLVKPEKSRFDLPLNTMFPMQHAAHLIKTARYLQPVSMTVRRKAAKSI
jgi:EipB-like